jgi:hypothetical protein
VAGSTTAYHLRSVDTLRPDSLTHSLQPALVPRVGHALVQTADQRLIIVGGMGLNEGTVATVERLSPPKGRARRTSAHVGATARAMQVEHLEDSDMEALTVHWKLDPADAADAQRR